MNITTHSVGKIKTPNGKIIDYDKPFNCLQTTTSDTFTIIESPDPLSAYKQWLVANNYKNNLSDLEEFVKESDDNEFKIEVSYI
jgi:hypothetical protein